MIRRLRLKFICINMTIVTAMLCVIFGLVIHFTAEGMVAQNIRVMQEIASAPMLPARPERPDLAPPPGRPPEQHALPFFVLELDADGTILAAESSYYDLSDQTQLQTLVSAADKRPSGFLFDYGLQYLHATSPTGHRIVL